MKYRPTIHRGADKSLARPGGKQPRKHVRDVLGFNNIETRAVIKFLFFFLQGKAPKEIHAILTETLPCVLPGRAKDLSAPLYKHGGCVGKPQNFRVTLKPLTLLATLFPTRRSQSVM